MSLRNFGPFANWHATFEPTGINLILGLNSTGKTQIFGAFNFAAFGEGTLTRMSISGSPTEVSLKLHDNGQAVRIQRRIKQSAQTAMTLSATSENTGHDLLTMLRDSLHASHDFLASVQGLHRPANEVPFSNHHFERFTELLAGNSEALSYLDHLHREVPKYRWETASGGFKEFWQLLRWFAAHAMEDSALPLILDTPFMFLAPHPQRFALAVLEAIARHRQIILLTFDESIAENFDIASVQHLEIPAVKRYSIFSYDYRFKPERPSKDPEQSLFRRGEIAPRDEVFLIEYKEVKGSNPVDSIKNTADEYAVAFLNSDRSGSGVILWGIRDADGVVVGVQLDRAQRDALRRKVLEKLHTIQPTTPPSAFRLTLHPVYDADRVVEDLFVVELLVPPGAGDYFYATCGGQVFIKTDSGRKALSPLQLQMEVLKRHRLER